MKWGKGVQSGIRPANGELRMLDIKEVVCELIADGFTNNPGPIKGVVLRSLRTGRFSCESDGTVRRVDLPSGEFASAEEAKAALLEYWDKCEEQMPYGGFTFRR